MIWSEKVMNIKVVEFIKIYNFYFGHFFIWQSATVYTKIWEEELQELESSQDRVIEESIA